MAATIACDPRHARWDRHLAASALAPSAKAVLDALDPLGSQAFRGMKGRPRCVLSAAGPLPSLAVCIVWVRYRPMKRPPTEAPFYQPGPREFRGACQHYAFGVMVVAPQ